MSHRMSHSKHRRTDVSEPPIAPYPLSPHTTGGQARSTAAHPTPTVSRASQHGESGISTHGIPRAKPARHDPRAGCRHAIGAAQRRGGWFAARRLRAGASALVAALATVASVSVAWAAPASVGSVGRDVSYPQCSGALPTSAAFAIVGVGGGRAFSANPCLATQYTWAAGRPSTPGVYVNTGNPAPRSAYYWPVSGERDPTLCRDSTSVTDAGCAYDYGWHAAADALAVGAGAGVPRTITWWLDVETVNSWNGDAHANAADLQGMVDRLRSAGVLEVGIYSTAHQWTSITGGYTRSNASGYRTAWRSAFTPRFVLEAAPLWIATAGDRAAGSAACTTSFTGGSTRLAQYADGSGLDADLVCR